MTIKMLKFIHRTVMAEIITLDCNDGVLYTRFHPYLQKLFDDAEL